MSTQLDAVLARDSIFVQDIQAIWVGRTNGHFRDGNFGGMFILVSSSSIPLQILFNTLVGLKSQDCRGNEEDDNVLDSFNYC